MCEIRERIRRICKEKNAIILAHYYTRAEVQEVADFIGDSLALAQQAARTDADIILMCGVHFMAETCKMLCMDRKVLIPVLSAGCSLADSCDANELHLWREQHPDYKVVSYVNTTIDVKALSDICVTSGNALKIIQSFPKEEKLLFCPDRNLGSYINSVTGREMELWNGGCHVHGRFSVQALKTLKDKHPEARIMAHPECGKDILALADTIGSTAAILKAVGEAENSSVEEFIIATELGILYELRKSYPDRTFFTIPRLDSVICNECEHMKLCTLENILSTLENETPEITLDASLAKQAVRPILRMLELSK